MLPFRELVKRNAKFTWNNNLQQIFDESKITLVNAVRDGVKSFDHTKYTCIQCDWSKEGLGYLLLQKHCSCPIDDAPKCCPSGWKLIFAGSRFTKGAESRYSPSEGEALAVAWSLSHAKLFILGCKQLIVVTDHKPLLGIFRDLDLDTIDNPRIQKLKRKDPSVQVQNQVLPRKMAPRP